MPDWLIPVVTFISGIFGGFIGARVSIVRLETQMAEVMKWKEVVHRRTHNLNEDVLIHDIEIEELMRKNGLDRIRRQAARRQAERQSDG